MAIRTWKMVKENHSVITVSESKPCVFFQIPFYRGERITFDVAPSRLDFIVEHDSLQIEVRPSEGIILLCHSFL